MTTKTVKFTYEDYKYLPEGADYEVIEGKLLMSPPSTTLHQTIILKLAVILNAYALQHGGHVFVAPLDVLLSDENIVQPDLIFISDERQSNITPADIKGAPDLLIEVISPGTEGRDAKVKRKLYAKYGVREYWLVNPEAKTIEVTANRDGLLETEQVYPQGTTARSVLLAELAVEVSPLFSPARG